ncbi:HAMP domain-containing methyl-accepting chemotaxis protein [Novosphingobium rosa]|uniref:HAMP domain-containing methyl-accepting chemotaxis protein n=1 Tax=Novosphingobium rosa TaxID=76978 RepID=UPI001471D4BC|nr:HAMP domain-containing methyl-accepting chemotaxis protein [Novosphingobium rosa]
MSKIGNAILASAAIACALVGLHGVHTLGDDLRATMDDTLPGLVLLDKIDDHSSMAQLATDMAVAGPDRETRRKGIGDYLRIESETDQLLRDYQPLISDDTERREYNDVTAAWNAYKIAARATLPKDTAQNEDHAALDNSLSKVGADLSHTLDIIVLHNRTEADRAGADGKRAVARTNQLGLLLMAVAIIAAAAGIALFLHRVIRPLLRLSAAMQDMASGDLDREVPGQHLTDEVGQIGRALGAIKEGVARRIEEQAQAQMEQQRQVVSELGKGLAALKGGHLTASIHHPFSHDYDALRCDFNEALATMAGLMCHVDHASQSVKSGASDISDSAADLAQRTEQQASSLTVTANAVRHLTVSVTHASQDAAEAARLARNALNHASSGSEVMTHAVAAMAQIAQSSRKMEEIVSLIDGIAFQTNLLALNAGVEAARAGEAGRGFAIVAHEVRELSQRSSLAARDIAAIIRESVKDVAAGVDMIARSQVELEHISAQTSQLQTRIDGLAMATGDQVSAIGQVEATMGEFDLLTRKNLKLVEESTRSAQTLAQQALILEGLIHHFEFSQNSQLPSLKGSRFAA